MQGLGFAGTPTSPVAAVPVPRQWPWHDGERLHPQGADERLHTDPSISSAWLLDILSMLLPEFLQVSLDRYSSKINWYTNCMVCLSLLVEVATKGWGPDYPILGAGRGLPALLSSSCPASVSLIQL